MQYTQLYSARGVQRGEAPLRSLMIPQEWGTKGLITVMWDACRGRVED